jgi:hypothetical protein
LEYVIWNGNDTRKERKSSTKKGKVEETSIPIEMSISGSNIVNTRTSEVPKIIVERNKVSEKWKSKFLFADDEDDE